MSDLQAELLGVVEHAIANHPRSLQVAAGPSELGHPCKARLAYKFAGAPEVNPNRRTPWKPTVGTAVHTWLDETFSAANRGREDFNATGGRYWCEVRVNVGEILGQAIEGNCDLFVGNPASTVPGKVVDFKIVGDDQLRKYKREGPGDQYRIQAHLYGRGWTRRGAAVDTVGVWFLPRNQELRQNWLWTEPYDEQVALDALTRAEGIAKLTRQLGTGAAALLGRTESWCQFCPYFSPGSTDPAAGCPGEIKAKDPAAEFAGLLAS